MQAILTKVLPATNTKPTRIKAECARGSKILSTDSIGDISKPETHAFVARHLVNCFVNEDKAEYDSDPKKNPWAKPFVTGCLPNGDYVHVFTA